MKVEIEMGFSFEMFNKMWICDLQPNCSYGRLVDSEV